MTGIFLYPIQIAIEKAIGQHYAPASDATGPPCLSWSAVIQDVAGWCIWHGGLSNEGVEDMANANLHVMRLLGLYFANLVLQKSFHD